MAERVRKGRPASPGIGIGPLVRLPRATAAAMASGDAATERARLEAALETARVGLDALIADEEAMAAEILAFQRELLDDPTLTEPALTAIGAGKAAGESWRAALASQVEDYEASGDEYFRARAADLQDVCDRVLAALATGAPTLSGLPEGAVLLDTDITPSRFLALDWQRYRGLALEQGSPAAHAAMLARARGVPMVTGLGSGIEAIGPVVLDGEQGLLVTAPAAATLTAYRARHAAAGDAIEPGPVLTADGEPVEIMLNLDDPGAVDDRLLQAADGVGLMRTEFLFLGRERLPGEAEQIVAYRELLDRLGGKPLIVRTLDIGGDKPLPALRQPEESNPFLGLRGIRLCLERPELFAPQVRALLQVAPGRPLKVMLPMVATAAELAETRVVFERCLAELQAAGRPAAMPPLGIMVETPAAAIAVDLIPAEFYSIGSNDLTQYVMAAARDAGGRVGALNDALQPAVLRLIARVVTHGVMQNLPVSMCGDMAGDPRAIGQLLDLGLRRLSVAPAAFGRVQRAVRAWNGSGKAREEGR